MDLDRQDEIESPVIEDFLDCDQLVSDSDGDNSGSPPSKKTPGRLHIPDDMSSTQFMNHTEQSQMDSLSIFTSGPQTGAYHSSELDPYSAVGSPASQPRHPPPPSPTSTSRSPALEEEISWLIPPLTTARTTPGLWRFFV